MQAVAEAITPHRIPRSPRPPGVFEGTVPHHTGSNPAYLTPEDAFVFPSRSIFRRPGIRLTHQRPGRPGRKGVKRTFPVD